MDGDAASEAAELETFKDQLEESRAKGSSMPDDTEAFTAAYKKHADLVQDSAGKHEFKEVRAFPSTYTHARARVRTGAPGGVDAPGTCRPAEHPRLRGWRWTGLCMVGGWRPHFAPDDS